MNGLPSTRLLQFRELIANAIRVVALIFVTGPTAITPQVEAADWVPSVAGQIPTAPADVVRPLTVIDQQDIELSGMRNIEELLLHRLPYNSFGVYRPYILGENRVAVLINGRRI